MPFINIMCWPVKPEVKKILMEEVTRAVHSCTGAPLDKITIVLQEVTQGMWCDAGILGSDTNFLTKSRRLNYEETA